MKRILTTTTAFAVALSAMQPLPAFAEQDNCMPGLPCDASDAAKQKAQQEAERKAQEEAERAAAQAAQQEQEAARAADEAAAADRARQQAEADQQAAEQAAREQAEAAAQAEAEAAAQAQAEADARAQAEAEQRAADEAAAAEAARQQQAEADAAAAAAEAEAQQKAAEADQAADDAAKAAESAAQEAAEAPAPDATPEAADPDVADGQADQPVILPAPTEDAATAAPDGEAAPETDPAAEAAEAAPEAEAADPADPAEPAQTARDGGVLSPFPTAPAEPTQEQVKTLDSILQQPAVVDGAEAPAEAPPAAAAAEAAPPTDGKPLDAAPSPDAVVTTETLTEENTRTSDKDFTLRPDGMTPAPQTGSGTETADRPRARKDDDGMSDLAKVGLVALGALAVGALLSDGREVVQNSGDRVVLRDDDGRYYVYKDDDAVMRRPGSTVRTEQYGDGSTRTIVERRDGTQVVTIRDASGRVLRRTSFDQRGREVVLFDDMVIERPIVVSDLPRPRAERMTLSASDQDAALRARLLAEQTRAELGRGFSLRQIRDIPQVRDLAAMVDVDNITFETGSAAIRPAQAETLASLGRFIKQLLEDNPGEVFLIEGHTDAVGSDYSNLALSDRRAESVALALTEYFDVPPENLIVQGYGKSDLRIDTPSAEPLNRRVAVRVITPLLQTAAAD